MKDGLFAQPGGDALPREAAGHDEREQQSEGRAEPDRDGAVGEAEDASGEQGQRRSGKREHRCERVDRSEDGDPGGAERIGPFGGGGHRAGNRRPEENEQGERGRERDADANDPGHVGIVQRRIR